MGTTAGLATGGGPDRPADAGPPTEPDAEGPADAGQPAEPDAGPTASPPRPRRRLGDRPDLSVGAALAVATAVVEAILHAVATRPLWYDELWRAHYLSVPAGQFYGQLRHANSPSAVGWLALERGIAALAGWYAWVLRIPEIVTLPLLTAGLYLLGRRFLPRPVAAVAAVVVGLNGTVLDLGLQLKPYTLEAVATLGVVGLWAWAPASGTGPRRTRILRLTGAGLLTLFTVPLAFLVAPLAVLDVANSPGGWRRRARAAVDTAPALVLTAAHSLVFIARQSGQRHGSFWDGQQLAGRGFGGGTSFVARQVWRVAGGLPTGIDRVDPNLVHAPTDATAVSAWVIAPLVLVAWGFGARRLWRDRPGRLLVGGLAGAEVIELVASAARFWPFGAARPNTFLIPLLVVVAAAGVVEVGQLALRPTTAPRGAPRVIGATGLIVTLALGWATIATTVRLWDSRDGIRLQSRIVDATLTARAEARPGDVVLVGGRLAATGWAYAMDASDDGPTAGGDVPIIGRIEPRIGPGDTVYLTAVGDGEGPRALAARGMTPRRDPGRHVLLFVANLDRAGQDREVAELAHAGWCPTGPPHAFANTGNLFDLGACGASADRGRPTR
ncbi:MAG: hypothetical protein ACQSGP_08465 [Frankia sp.]